MLTVGSRDVPRGTRRVPEHKRSDKARVFAPLMNVLGDWASPEDVAQLGRDLETARDIQARLLPPALPNLAGVEIGVALAASKVIGGDFYDFIRLSDTTAAAIIGDVQGHNVTAAALMGQVRTAVHAHATAGAPPDQVLARTNRFLADIEFPAKKDSIVRVASRSGAPDDVVHALSGLPATDYASADDLIRDYPRRPGEDELNPGKGS